MLSFQSNALKFTPNGGAIRIVATKVAQLEASFVRIEVVDNGTGISEANQQKLFKMFGYLNETQVLNSQGIGLGLYITKMIVNAFDGEVGVRS